MCMNSKLAIYTYFEAFGMHILSTPVIGGFFHLVHHLHRPFFFIYFLPRTVSSSRSPVSRKPTGTATCA